MSEKYVGRFAPSPSGPLHFGSLIAAVASYLDAKTNNGEWLLRIEDLDRLRTVPGAPEKIITTLEAYGFEWDGTIIYQSQRTSVYQAYLAQLHDKGLIYPCRCSRKEIASLAHAGIEGAVYPGTCSTRILPKTKARAWRVRVENRTLSFEDLIYQHVEHQMVNEIGDFILKRADGLFAYQLAVVVDDANQGVNHIVRGADLLNSTTRQIYLQQQLDFATPQYAHIPLAINNVGEKLSKQTKAPPISNIHIEKTLLQALAFLNMNVPDEIGSLADIWQWAIAHWQLSQLSPKPTVINNFIS